MHLEIHKNLFKLNKKKLIIFFIFISIALLTSFLSFFLSLTGIFWILEEPLYTILVSWFLIATITMSMMVGSIVSILFFIILLFTTFIFTTFTYKKIKEIINLISLKGFGLIFCYLLLISFVSIGFRPLIKIHNEIWGDYCETAKDCYSLNNCGAVGKYYIPMKPGEFLIKCERIITGFDCINNRCKSL